MARDAEDKTLLQTAGLGLAPDLRPHHGFDPGRCPRNCIVFRRCSCPQALAYGHQASASCNALLICQGYQDPDH